MTRPPSPPTPPLLAAEIQQRIWPDVLQHYNEAQMTLGSWIGAGAVSREQARYAVTV